MRDKTRIPVIVGAGQVTDTTSPPERARSPLQLMQAAALSAGQDRGSDEALLKSLDSITVIRLFADTMARFISPFGKFVNAPWSLAQRLGAKQATDLVYPPHGGDSPQVMLTRACERIASGQSQCALIVGAEALRTELAARRAGLELKWGEEAPFAPDELEGPKIMYSLAEEQHGMRSAIAMYALIGQAVRHGAAQTVDEYRDASAKLFARFASVAKDNPLATRRKGYEAAAIRTETVENPFVGFPYTKLMTSNAFVDQAAAVLVLSEARADQLGIRPDKRVYLHGTAAGHDHWYVSERAQLERSSAMRLTAQYALAQADKRLDEVAFFDLYSCFPSAVQIACRELGISLEDPRGLTITGGLPYFGGPGNNYVMHAIAEMVQRVRSRPGSYGLVMANGGLVTKEAAGLYSTARPTGELALNDSAVIQDQIDRETTLTLAEQPQGEAVIETYAVLHGKGGPERGLLFGRTLSTGERFVANTPSDPITLARLQTQESLGLSGSVSQVEGLNIFVPRF